MTRYTTLADHTLCDHTQHKTEFLADPGIGACRSSLPLRSPGRGLLNVWASIAILILVLALPVQNAIAGEGATEVTVSEADASESQSFWDTVRYGFGARIGGYMFREHMDDGGVAWEGCRMDGAGLFGTMDFGEYWFSELSFDFYAANSDVVRSHGMDRISLLSLISVGFRMFPDWVVSPNVHLGGGLEWTDYSFVEHGVEEQSFLGVGFIGLGLDFNLGDHFRMGANLRILAMGLPQHDHGGSQEAGHHDKGVTAHTDGALADGTDGGASVEYQPAGQLLLFVRYRL